MSSAFFQNIIRFIVLILLQIIVFNNINLLGYVNPYIYIVFLILYPVNANRYGLLIAGFLLGLTMDMFSDSGGIHSAACLFLAYFRPFAFKVAFGLSYEYQTIKISKEPIVKQFVFVSIVVLVHHLVLFLLEAFSLALVGKALLKVLFSGIITLIFSLLIINLFSAQKK